VARRIKIDRNIAHDECVINVPPKDPHLTSTTGETVGQLLARFLSQYTATEGWIEEIGFVYLRSVPPEIADILVGRLPWSAGITADLLSAVVEREDFEGYAAPPVIRSLGTGRPVFPYATEWRWATRARNDLAHSIAEPRGGAFWGLRPRSSRRDLRLLIQRFTADDLLVHVDRLEALLGAILDLAGYLGVEGSGWEGPGPKPIS
jgi:hypothetical protein